MPKPSRHLRTVLAASIAALLAQTAGAQLTWNSAGPTDVWSTVAGNENWLPGVTWINNSSAIFDATSGTPEAISVAVANTVFDDITFGVGGFSITSAGAGSLLLGNDLASTITVTNAADSASLGETIGNNAAGASTLTKAGAGTLILNGTAANTYSGGTILSGGTLIASHEGALGTGNVVNNATLNLNKANVTFTGLSTGMSGNGIVNVTALGTGTNTVALNGNYSGFTGTWNVGVGAAVGAGKVQFNGLDNAAATINVLANATVYSASATTHNASILLNGGDTGEALGQLRLESGANWAGSVTLAGAITGAGDGFIGSNTNATGTISGVIGETGGSRVLSKTGAGTTVLSGLNTYSGGTSILAGTLGVSALNNTGSAGNVGIGGTISIGAGATGAALLYSGAGETTDRVIDLAGTTGGATLTQLGTGLLKFTGNLTASGAGNKTLTLNGTGIGEFAGNIVNGTGTTAVTKNGTGTWILSGNNTHTGQTNASGGVLVAASAGALGAAGAQVNMGAAGAVLELATDSSINAISLNEGSNIGATTLRLSRATSGPAITQTLGSLLMGINDTLTVEAGSNIASGKPSVFFPQWQLTSGVANGISTLAPTTASVTIGAVNIPSGFQIKTAVFDGTGTGNTVTGAIANGALAGAVLSVTKSNTGTWTFSGANSYTGGTAVNGGTLVLDYSAQDNSKLADSAVLTLGGGTLDLSGSAGGHLETVLSTTLTTGSVSSVTRSSGAAVLQMNAVSGAGGAVNFGAGNIATTDNLNVNGILPWARFGNTWGANATNTADGFIVPYTGYSDVTRQGGILPDGVANNVRIINGGTTGRITLAGSPLNRINSLQMDASDGPALIGPAAATDVLSVGDEAGGTIWQTATSGGLTIGTAANDGVLTTGNTENGVASTLTLLNDNTSSALTINSTIANNGSTTPDVVSLAKGGAGTVILAGNNTFTGGITTGAGTLILSGNNSFAGALTLNNAGTTVILSGNNAGRPAATTGLTTINGGATLQLQANAGNTSGGVSTALSSEQTANQPLVLNTGGTLQLRGDSSVTFAGGNNLGGLGSATVTFDVNQLTSAGSGATLTIAPGGFNVNTTTINVTGGNGYRLGTGVINNVAGSGNLTLNPTSANMTVGGYTASATLSTTLTLSGTSTGNVVSGPVANPATSGATTLAKSGTSTWTLNGVNTYTGATTIGAGTLAIGGSGSLGSGLYAGAITDNGAFIYGSSAVQTLSGVISGSGTVTQAGTGVLTLSGANTYTGVTNITSGVVVAQNNTALGSAAAGTTVSSGATLDLGGALALSALNLGTEVITVSGAGVDGNGALVNNGSNDQINATGRIVLAGDTTFGGAKRWDLRSSTPTLDMGGFNLTKTGPNSISLVGVKVSNPGQVAINSGIFSVETTTDLGGDATNKFTVNSGGTLQFYQNSVVLPWSVILNGGTMSQVNASTTVSGPVTLGTGTGTLNVAGTSLTLTGAVTGPGGFNKTGAGLLTLSGTNDFRDTATISAGRVVAGSNTALGNTSGTVNVVSGAQLELANGVTVAGKSVTIAGSGMSAGTGAFRGALQATSNATATWAGTVVIGADGARIGAQPNATLIVSGPIVDGPNGSLANDLDISGDATNGRVVLSAPAGANTYTGRTGIARGTLALGANNTLPLSTVLDIDAFSGVPEASVVDLNGFNQQVAGLQDSATTNVNGLLTNSAAGVSTFTVNGAADFVYDGAISGSVNLTKTGSGRQALNGASFYTGATTVDGGTLLVGGSITGSATAVNNGGTLGGTGRVDTVLVNSGGTLAPGGSIGGFNGLGTLSTANVSLTSGATLALEIDRGINASDLLAIVGNLSLADTGSVILSLTDLSGAVSDGTPLPLITYTGTWNGHLFTYGGSVIADGGTLTVGVNTYTLDYDYNGNSVALLAVPEPGAALTLLGGMGMLLGLRRRRS